MNTSPDTGGSFLDEIAEEFAGGEDFLLLDTDLLSGGDLLPPGYELQPQSTGLDVTPQVNMEL